MPRFQDLLPVSHATFDFFHFVSLHNRGWDSCPNGLQLSLKTRRLLTQCYEELGQTSQLLVFTIAHAPRETGWTNM
jgi:hypothetical protein